MKDFSSLLAVTVTACVTILGWYVANYLTSSRESAARKTEARKRYIERQIEELYGPLFNLTQQLASVRDIRAKILTTKWELEHKDNDNDEIVEIRRFIRTDCVHPIFEKMESILTNRLFLLEDNEMPPSFQKLLRHITQNDTQHRLWTVKNISTINVEGTPYPDDFPKDVAAALSRLTNEYRVMQGHVDSK